MKHGRATGWRYRELAFGAMVLALGVVGLLDVRFGNWRPGPGGGNHLVPMVAYWVLVACGAAMLLGRLRAGWQPDADRLRVPLLAVAGALVWGVVFFSAVRHIGLAVSATVLIGAAMLALAPQVERRPVLLVLVALAAGTTFWVLFTWLAPILVAEPILF